jgi:hypothetical protein
MHFTLGQAAKETGKAKGTISKAIHSGRLSANRDNNGNYAIDPAELFRVYPANSNATGSGNPKNEQQETPNELIALRAKVDSLQEQSKQARETVEDLRRRLDEAERERRDKDRALTALLTDQRDRSGDVAQLKAELEAQAAQLAAERQRGFWSRLVGRKA